MDSDLAERSRATDIIALHNIALIYEATGRPQLAAAIMQRVLDKDPGYLAAKWELGLMRLGMGDLSAGFAGYETRTERFVDLSDPEFDGMLHWAGQCIEDKAILIVGEHGIGDSILFSRFIPWICEHAGKVWFRAAPEMRSLLWEMHGMLEFLPEDVPPPHADYFLFIGSLAHFYDSYAYADPPPPRLRTVDDIPPDPGFIRRRIDKEMTVSK